MLFLIVRTFRIICYNKPTNTCLSVLLLTFFELLLFEFNIVLYSSFILQHSAHHRMDSIEIVLQFSQSGLYNFF